MGALEKPIGRGAQRLIDRSAPAQLDPCHKQASEQDGRRPGMHK